VIGDYDGKKHKSGGSAVSVYEGLWVHPKSMITGLIASVIIHMECLLNSLINMSQM
jgi:hypothetical protein